MCGIEGISCKITSIEGLVGGTAAEEEKEGSEGAAEDKDSRSIGEELEEKEGMRGKVRVASHVDGS